MKKKDMKITNIIGKGAECSGDFTAEGSVRVDGTINGNVKVSGTLIVGATGNINGDVDAAAAIVGGEIIGDVRVTERTELTGTARVIGNITTVIIVIDEHAIFQGSCNMNQAMPEKRPKPPLRTVRAVKKSAKAAIEEALKEVEAANREEAADGAEADAGTGANRGTGAKPNGSANPSANANANPGAGIPANANANGSGNVSAGASAASHTIS